MAQLSKSSFLTKWAELFADNTTGDISEQDMRDFRQDISDSFFSIEDNAYSSRGISGIDTIAGLKALGTTALNTASKIHSVFRDTGNSNVLRVYELVSGTDAESSPDIIRPTDYAGGTNEKVWKLAVIGTSGSVTITAWDFSGGFPTSSGILYIATADNGTRGDPDYVPEGTWFIANTAAPSAYSDFYYK